jgi:RsiW-degrading membrane proteinase PrsW (M82 family)
MEWLNNPFLMIIIGIVPGLIWLTFFLKEDIHPEPRRLIFYTFLVGAMMSLPVLASQFIFQKTLSLIGQFDLALIIGLALIEEVFKFFAAYLAIFKNPNFDEPIDAMIYTITAALGFATIENIFITLGTDINQIASLTSLRFVGATFLHALASALVGYQWAKGIISQMTAKFVFKGLIYAIALHSFFNYLILSFQEKNLFYAIIILIIAAFFVFTDFEKLKEKQNTTLE